MEEEKINISILILILKTENISMGPGALTGGGINGCLLKKSMAGKMP
jgi:hypothetical protein